MATIPDVLMRAADIIEPTPRLLRTDWFRDGCFCTGGAIIKAINPEAKATWDFTNEQHRLFTHVDLVWRRYTGNSIVDWNDHHAIDPQDVAREMRRIAREEAHAEAGRA